MLPFFAISRVSGLGSIVTAIDHSPIRQTFDFETFFNTAGKSIVLAIDTQTSNPILNGGAGEGEVKFFDGIMVERQM